MDRQVDRLARAKAASFEVARRSVRNSCSAKPFPLQKQQFWPLSLVWPVVDIAAA